MAKSAEIKSTYKEDIEFGNTPDYSGTWVPSNLYKVVNFKSYSMDEKESMFAYLRSDLLEAEQHYLKFKQENKDLKDQIKILSNQSKEITNLNLEINNRQLVIDHVLRLKDESDKKFTDLKKITLSWCNSASRTAKCINEQKPAQVQAIIGEDYAAGVAIAEVCMMNPTKDSEYAPSDAFKQKLDNGKHTWFTKFIPEVGSVSSASKHVDLNSESMSESPKSPIVLSKDAKPYFSYNWTYGSTFDQLKKTAESVSQVKIAEVAPSFVESAANTAESANHTVESAANNAESANHFVKSAANTAANTATQYVESATKTAESAAVCAESATEIAGSATDSVKSATVCAESATFDAESATHSVESAKVDTADSTSVDVQFADYMIYQQFVNYLNQSKTGNDKLAEYMSLNDFEKCISTRTLVESASTKAADFTSLDSKITESTTKIPLINKWVSKSVKAIKSANNRNKSNADSKPKAQIFSKTDKAVKSALKNLEVKFSNLSHQVSKLLYNNSAKSSDLKRKYNCFSNQKRDRKCYKCGQRSHEAKACKNKSIRVPKQSADTKHKVNPSADRRSNDHKKTVSKSKNSRSADPKLKLMKSKASKPKTSRSADSNPKANKSADPKSGSSPKRSADPISKIKRAADPTPKAKQAADPSPKTKRNADPKPKPHKSAVSRPYQTYTLNTSKTRTPIIIVKSESIFKWVPKSV